MMKNLLYSVDLIAIIVIFLAINSEGRISDKRLCVDPECSVPISLARAVLKYHADDAQLLSFSAGDTITIYSKGAGIRTDLWGGELRGKRGYIPKNLVQEMKIFQASPKIIVPTSQVKSEPAPVKEGVEEAPQEGAMPAPNTAVPEQEPFYVVDGTTLYMPEDSSMQMTYNSEPQPKSTPDVIPVTTSQEASVDHTASVASPTPPAEEAASTSEKPSEESVVPDEPASNVAAETEPVQSTPKIPEDATNQETVEATEKVPADVEMNPKEEGSVLEYLSDTLNGWMSGDGEDDEEDEGDDGEEGEQDEGEQDEGEEESEETSQEVSSDTGQEITKPVKIEIPLHELDELQTSNEVKSSSESHDPSLENVELVSNKSEESTEDFKVVVPDVDTSDSKPQETESSLQQQAEPVLEVKQEIAESLDGVDLSKINLLSSNANIVSPEVTSSSLESAESQDSQEAREQEANLIDEISYVKEVPTELPATGPPPVPVASHYSAPPEIEEPVSSKTGEQSVDPVTETPPTEVSTEATPEETVTPPSISDFEPPAELDIQTTTETPEEIKSPEAPTPSPIFYEPSPTELPNQEEIEISTPSQQNLSGVDDINISDLSPQDSKVPEETPSVSFEGTVEEVTTLPPPIVDEIKTEEEQEDSGVFFASWVYNLLGYVGLGDSPPAVSEEGALPAEETTTAVPEVTTQATVEVTTEAAEGQSASYSSWLWGASEEPKVEEVPTQTCSAELGGLGCVEVGSEPKLIQEEAAAPPSSAPHHQEHHHLPAEEVTVLAMDWDTAASSGILIYLLVTSVTVLVFTLGHYYIEKTKKDGVLIAKINCLQKELMVSTKECLILKDDLESTKEKVGTSRPFLKSSQIIKEGLLQLSSVETSTSGSSEVLTEMEMKLEECEKTRVEQEEQIASLEKELEAATEAGLELNKMLSEFLSAQRGSEDLSKSVELLQQQLNKQQTTISTMNQALSAKALEAEEVKGQLGASEARVRELEGEVAKVTERLEEVQKQRQQLKEDLEESCVTLANQLQEAATQREAEVSELRQLCETSEARLEEVEDSLRARSSEVEVLQSSLAQLQQLDGDASEQGQKKLQALMDVGRAQAELKLILSERDVLKERLQCEEDARQLLEDHVKVIREEVEKLRERHEAAEKEKVEAQTKLEVLSSYFKEKETQLQKELGLQEAMFVQKKEDVSVTHVRIKSLEEEIENYRAQNETLKQEIIDQERGLKGQITTLEKKAHDNWIAARQAERKLDETKQEAGTLRNRLTMLEKGASVAQNGEEGKPAQRLLDTNGEHLPTSPLLHLGDSPSMSPPHLGGHPPHYMMMPPPPPPVGSYLPPPPPPEYLQSPPPPLPLYPDRRPPPLGRMSSPPPHHFSPPPPDRYVSPYRPRSPASDRSLPRYRYGSRSPSPPPYGHPDYPPYSPSGRWDEPPRSGFRPLHRDKDHKGSTLSSGHSSESLDKSSRHSGGKS